MRVNVSYSRFGRGAGVRVNVVNCTSLGPGPAFLRVVAIPVSLLADSLSMPDQQH